MGQVFQRTYKGKDGTVRKCETWTIRYYRHGRPFQEPTEFTKKTQAIDLLKEREGDIAKGLRVTSAAATYRFEDAEKDIVNDYTINKRRSLSILEGRIENHLRPWFKGRKLTSIDAVEIRAYTKARLDAGASRASVNRELAALKRMWRLAMDAHPALRMPKIAMLREDNVRQGFLDADQFEAVCARLPAAAVPVVRMAYLTGWRIQSEVLPIEWRHVDRTAGEVRLDPGTTKNGEGRVFPFTDELRSIIDAQWTAHEALKSKGTICPFVFHRNGKRIKTFRASWAKACKAAGCPGKVPHDLRRCAVRTMERRGLSRSVGMKLTGHKTESVYRRYAITSEADLQEAVRRLNRDSHRDSGGHSERSAG